ncbi:MAG: DUF3015 family protein [Pseudobdellovibrionaceae bacterium]|nr:DUF3015 family protein [Bdellovibrionales bacterium]USN46227.1 MAG: DUF3015 family protein [Pseudobdellovibrionaceae bacterium]
MRILSALSIFAVLGASQVAMAYGVAGCGLGSMLFQDNTFVSQSSAATSNFYSQPFAITLNTSNCKAQGFVMNDKEIQYFAEVNHEQLTEEMAKGEGEKLNVLAALHGCNAEGVKVFATTTQAHFGEILPSPNTTTVEMIENLGRVLESSAVLQQACVSKL